MAYIQITRNGQPIWVRNVYHSADGVFVGMVDSYAGPEYPFGSLVTFVKAEISDAAFGWQDVATVH